VNIPFITVIGAGLAGCEAAWQLAGANIPVRLFEMKPERRSPAHHSNDFAELVCSNSLRSDRIENAVGLLKEEMRQLGSLIISCADQTRVPAGGALAVDRTEFSQMVTRLISEHPMIEVVHGEVTTIPKEGVVIIATGPLTDGGMFDALMELVGDKELHFFDAAAPIIMSDSINRNVVYALSRYGKGGDDYLNCPMTEKEYLSFYDALIHAELAEVANFDQETVFEGCMPIETMAKRGIDTIRYGPLKPVGLNDPKTGKEPYACVQLRQDNRSSSMYNLVGFQTRLRFSEQQRVFRLIPGLENANFFRMGVMHRNTFVDSPQILSSDYSLRDHPRIFLVGQITGVEGYVESSGSGMLAGLYAASSFLGNPISPPLSEFTMIGAMGAYISDRSLKKFQPMNANFGIIAPLEKRIRNKKEKNLAYAERSLDEIREFSFRLSKMRTNSI
jgi:methylenetetrahydrofolate--tRNA-(uracil-5-)-methyltransferase